MLTIPASVWRFGNQARPPVAVDAWLSADVVRGADVPDRRVRITGACYLIRLLLEVEPAQYPSYRVTLHEVTGDEFWSQGQLKTETVEGRSAVTLTLACELLPDGDYYATLYGVSPDAPPVVVHRYDVRVLRE